jgi:hypothetical protein
MASGLLHVTMDPRESLSSSDFHDWFVLAAAWSNTPPPFYNNH